MDSLTISEALSSVFFSSALAAANAIVPPEPIAKMSSSGAIKSPVPDIKNEY